jgi:hypothetical protein
MSEDQLFHKLGEPQYCPVCGGNNPSGLVLPRDCVWCSKDSKAVKGNTYTEEEIKRLQYQNDMLVGALEYYAGCFNSADGGEEARSTLISLGIKDKNYLK